MIAFEKGIDYRFEMVEFKQPSHFALHPWGRVPIMKHGDLQLFETAAMGRYFESIGKGPKLVPEDPVRAAKMDQWISVVNCYAYQSLVTGYLFDYIFPKTPDQKPDRAAIDRDFPAAKRDLEHLERGFEGEWITGSTMTLADLFLAPILGSIANFPEAASVIESSPNLKRALRALSERPSYHHATPPR
jgi:glutathione S-transferase